MKVDLDLYRAAAESLQKADGGRFGPPDRATLEWLAQARIPPELISLFSLAMPKTEAWAGAGTIFSEAQICKWNEDFPEALAGGLFLIGSAPNGDHIAIKLETGETGYINHEMDWRRAPGKWFCAVSPSVGTYIQDINSSPSKLPDDYFEAIAKSNR